MNVKSLGWSALVMLVVSCVFLPVATAQQPVDDPVAAAAPPTVDSDAADDRAIREQSIYVPYKKLREVFEKSGRGVFLPYEEFQALWEKARGTLEEDPEVHPPVDVLITEIESEATVEKDVMRVSARLKIELLAEGWNEVPLRLADAAILSAKIGDLAARVVRRGDAGYTLLIQNETERPKQIELALQYAKAFDKLPGQNTVSVSFQAPQAPVNRWRIRIPESGVKVDVHPMIAATEEPGTAPEGEPAPSETVVLAFVGAAPLVRVDWTPKAEGASGLAALATAKVQQEVIVGEGVIRTTARLAFDISRAELAQLTIEVPADHEVVNVFDANVKQWKVEVRDRVRVITANLFEPAEGVQNVTVELEKFSDELLVADVVAPVIKAPQAGRQRGQVVVRLDGPLRAEATRSGGLLQLDAADLPQPLAGQPWAFSYHYAALPYDLALSVEKVRPRILSEELVEAYLEPEQLTLDLLALYDVQRAGVFQLTLDVPEGFEVRQVRGHAAAGAQAVVVDSHHADEQQPNRLVVNLSRKALGRVGLFVELHRRLADENLLKPTGNASTIPLPWPRVAKDAIERSNGRLVVYAPESLRVNPGTVDGLQSISFTEAFQGTESTRGGRFSAARPVLAYAYTDQTGALELSAERRKPNVTVGQLLTARIEAGVVRYEATFYYDVRFSGVESFRIDVPEDLSGEIHNQTVGVREQAFEPGPDETAPAAGYVAWRLAGQSEFLGASTVKLTWERKIDELEVGQGIDLNIPPLRPVGVDRAWGQIVATKAETIDVRPTGTPSGLRPIDPRHDLMPGAAVADAAMAFEFHDDWSLILAAKRYKLETVKQTSVERAVLRTVVTRSDQIAVQALYRMRSARQRLQVALPAGVDPATSFDTQPLSIDGRPVALERGEADEYFVPLVGQDPEKPFVMELRYTVPGSAARIDFPTFPDEPAMQKVFLCVYLPEELALLGSTGPWNHERNEWLEAIDTGQLSAYTGDGDLVSWVTEDVSISGNPAAAFQTDGRLYVFATLQPESPPGGSLRLSTVNDKLLCALVFGGVFVLGMLLLTRPIRIKFAALAILAIALILAGVFLPTFSLQVIDGVFVAAVVLVLFVWVAWFVVRVLPGRLAACRAACAARAPKPVAAQAVSTQAVSTQAVKEPDTSEPAETAPAESPPDAKEADAKAETAEPSPDEEGTPSQSPPAEPTDLPAPPKVPETPDPEAPEDKGPKNQGGETDA